MDTLYIGRLGGLDTTLSMLRSLTHHRSHIPKDMSHMLIQFSLPFLQLGTSCNQSQVSSQTQDHICNIFSECNLSNYHHMVSNCLLGSTNTDPVGILTYYIPHHTQCIHRRCSRQLGYTLHTTLRHLKQAYSCLNIASSLSRHIFHSLMRNQRIDHHLLLANTVLRCTTRMHQPRV